MKPLKKLLSFCIAALFFSCQHTPQRPVEMSDRQILGLTDKVQQVTLISQHIDEEKRDTTFLTFDSKGRMTEKIEHLQKAKDGILKTKYVYDDAQHTRLAQTYKSDGTLLSEELATYNAYNFVEKYTLTNGETKEVITVVFNYSADGLKAEVEATDGKGELFLTSNIEYNPRGQAVKEEVYITKDKKHSSTTYYVYDEKGALIDKKDYNIKEKNIRNYTFTHTYDNAGNKKEERIYIDGSLSIINKIEIRK